MEMKGTGDDLNSRLKVLIAIAIFVLVCLFAIVRASQFSRVGFFWYSIVPPLLAITMSIFHWQCQCQFSNGNDNDNFPMAMTRT